MLTFPQSKGFSANNSLSCIPVTVEAAHYQRCDQISLTKHLYPSQTAWWNKMKLPTATLFHSFVSSLLSSCAFVLRLGRWRGGSVVVEPGWPPAPPQVSLPGCSLVGPRGVLKAGPWILLFPVEPASAARSNFHRMSSAPLNHGPGKKRTKWMVIFLLHTFLVWKCHENCFEV